MKYSICYFFIAIALFEEPLSTIFGISGAHVIAEATMLVLVLTNLTNNKFKMVLNSTPVRLWAIWVIYSLVNWHLLGGPKVQSTGNLLYVLRNFILPISMLVVVFYESTRDINRLLKFLVFLFVLYIIVGLAFTGETGESVTEEGRGKTLLGNGLALSACILGFLSFFSYAKKIITRKVFFFIVTFSLFAIFYKSTRKALGGWLIIYIFFLMGLYDIKDSKKIIMLLVSTFGLYFAYTFVMDYTVIGQRLLNIESSSYDGSSLFLKYMGDRTIFYVEGWNLFIQHPLRGIGIHNFQAYFPYDIPPIHSEYMVELCENGVIGSVIYLLFNIVILRKIYKAFDFRPRVMVLVCFGGMACILFISFYAWTYSFPRYFIVYGVILAYCLPLSPKQIKRSRL